MIVFEKNHQTHAEGDRKDNPLKASSQRSLRGRHSSPRATSWLYIVSVNGSSLAQLPLLPQGDRKGLHSINGSSLAQLPLLPQGDRWHLHSKHHWIVTRSAASPPPGRPQGSHPHSTPLPPLQRLRSKRKLSAIYVSLL